jgi:hypothetical protein
MHLLRHHLRPAAVPSMAAIAFATLALRIHQSDAIHQHKPLWPLDARDVAGATLGALALIAAALGGVGGGGILLPIYILILDFRVKQAVALANATILGGAIANVLFAARRRHPYADRPSINWTLIILFEPLVIFGSVLGSFGNKLLPDAVLQTILVVLYASLSYTTTRKAVGQVHEEGGWGNLCKRLPLGEQQDSKATAAAAAARPPITSGGPTCVDEEIKQQQQQQQQQQPQGQGQGETTGIIAGGGRPRGQSYPPARERSPWLAKAGGGGASSYGTMPYDSDFFSGYSSSEDAKLPSPPPVIKRRVVQKASGLSVRASCGIV